MRNLIFVFISEAQRNFVNELFDSVEAQRIFAIAERHFRTKLKHNLTSATQISQHNANTALFAILESKRVDNLLKKADIYRYFDRNGTKLCSMYRIALLNEKKKKSESAAQLRPHLHCAYKITKFFYARTSRVSTLYKTALTSVRAYSVGGHNIMLN